MNHGRRLAPPPAEVDCYTVAEFCARNRIRQNFYYKLRREGRAPREMRIGRKTLIRREDAEAWRASFVAASFLSADSPPRERRPRLADPNPPTQSRAPPRKYEKAPGSIPGLQVETGRSPGRRTLVVVDEHPTQGQHADTGGTYLVWSHEHGAWWGPGRSGYTKGLQTAGRYSRDDALDICRNAIPTAGTSGPSPKSRCASTTRTPSSKARRSRARSWSTSIETNLRELKARTRSDRPQRDAA
jgi:hypothetical protein